MSIKCYIPSKNRACQLDLLLQSFLKNTNDLFEPTIVYTYSSDDFSKGYDLFRKEWPDLNIQYEYDSQEQFYQFLEKNENDLIALFTDDSIFYRSSTVSEQELRFRFTNPNLFTFTYRLGLNITVKDYVINEPAWQPDTLQCWENVVAWDYNKLPFEQLHGFTVGFDGYIFRAKDLLELSERQSFGGIATWENFICRKFKEKGFQRNLMASPFASEVFVQQVNITHRLGHRSSGQFYASLHDLNQAWLNGYEIDIDSMNFSNVVCTHGEIPFSVRKK